MVCLTNIDGSTTSCLRVFSEISTNSKKEWEYFDEPAHFRETNRIRINYEENQIYTCGSDGSVMIYNVEIYEGEKYDTINDRFSDRFSNVVLMKKSILKDKDSRKLNLPKKNEEELKKLKQMNEESKERKVKEFEDKRNELARKKQKGTKTIDQKEGDLRNLSNDFKKEEEIFN